MADSLTDRIDEQRFPANFFMNSFTDTVDSIDLLPDRLVNVIVRDDSGVLGACPIIGLAQQVRNASHMRREFVFVADMPGGLFEHQCHPRPVQRSRLFRFCQRGQHPRKKLTALQGAVGVVAEISRDLEQLVEIWIVALQQIVQQSVSQQHDFDVEWNRLGLE